MTIQQVSQYIILVLTLSRDSVTMYGIWIGNQIYWTLEHIARVYTLQITVTYRLVFSVTVFTALLGSGFQRCRVLRFRVKRLLSSLAGTFQLHLPS
jgi:hypothetical protein